MERYSAVTLVRSVVFLVPMLWILVLCTSMSGCVVLSPGFALFVVVGFTWQVIGYWLPAPNCARGRRACRFFGPRLDSYRAPITSWHPSLRSSVFYQEARLR